MIFTERERLAFQRHELEQRIFEASQPFHVRLEMLAQLQRTAALFSQSSPFAANNEAKKSKAHNIDASANQETAVSVPPTVPQQNVK
jgi:hypothetical protein